MSETNETPGLSRRAALKVLGAGGALAVAGGVAGCNDRTPPPVAAALHPAAHGAATPAAGTAAGGTPVVAPFFSARERETVTVLVDDIIPRDARSGSATDVGVPAWMDAFLTDAATEADFRRSIRGGLAWLNAESEKRFGIPYARAAVAQRTAILDDIAYPKRARPEMSQGVAFFNRFRDFTASGFFSSRAGWEDLRYAGNVAVPAWDGCPPEALAKLGVSYDVMATRVAPRTGGVRA